MSTLHVSEMTHSGVLLQSRTLESVSADKAGVATKRGADSDRQVSTGVQHGREEIVQGAPALDDVTLAPATAGREAGGGDSTTHTTVSTRVGVLDRDGQPLQPCHPARARELLTKGRARVHRLVPFVIRLVDRTAAKSVVDGVGVKIDPGSKATGLAVTVTRRDGTVSAIALVELVHRGLQIKNNLAARSALRRGRRSRNLRYRAPRWRNRARRPLPGMDVWLAPSIAHRVLTTRTQVRRLASWFPVTEVWVESVKFDTQLLENPEISGVEYQQGTLVGAEVREYLLEKYARRCVYCDTTDVPLNIDHVRPRARGGSNRVSNLALSCVPCNQAKGARPVEDFLVDNSARLRKVLTGLKRPLRDAAAVNTTRKALVSVVEADGFPVKTSTGGRTKYNRTRFGVPKTHALDALCVGDIDGVTGWPTQTLVVTSTGRGAHARTRSDKYGFPRLRMTRTKQHHGFITGDLVRAVVPTGKKAGTYVGRVAVRARGSFNITTKHGLVDCINHKHFRLLQRGDGYQYSIRKEDER